MAPSTMPTMRRKASAWPATPSWLRAYSARRARLWRRQCASTEQHCARYENLQSDEDKSCFLAGCLAVLGCTGYLLVDTGATKNVGGLQQAEDLQWKAIEHGLGESSFDIQERSRFAFGNGTGGESLGLAQIPARVDGALEKLDIHILDTDSPLLLGMPVLRRWRARPAGDVLHEWHWPTHSARGTSYGALGPQGRS